MLAAASRSASIKQVLLRDITAVFMTHLPRITLQAFPISTPRPPSQSVVTGLSLSKSGGHKVSLTWRAALG